MYKAVFGSPEWYTIVHEEAHALLAGLPEASPRFSMIERYRQFPAEYAYADTREPGFVLRLHGRTAELTNGVLANESADMTVSIEWDVVAQLVRLPQGPQFDAIAARALADGRFTVTGDPASAPISLESLHNAVAARTL